MLLAEKNPGLELERLIEMSLGSHPPNVGAMLLAAMFVAARTDEPIAVEEVSPRVKTDEVGPKATGQSRRISGKVIAATRRH